MRIHLLAPPNAPCTKEMYLDGFVQLTRRFSKLLVSLGHEVFLYGTDASDAPCSEFVRCVTIDDLFRLANNCPYQYLVPDHNHPLWQHANRSMIASIKERVAAHDIICTIGGTAQAPVCDALPNLLAVEWSIGYRGSFAPYRVFESRAWQHWTYGAQRIEDVRFYDAVIPTFFEADEFPFVEKPDPYILFVGRLTPKKGLQIAIDAAKEAGVELKVLGHGNVDSVPKNLHLIGTVDDEARNNWMARATALICPTTYIEPFGNIAAEAQLCGTPVICTDAGGFTESVVHGQTGFRCNLLNDFVKGIQACVKQPEARGYIRNRARRLYSMHAAAQSYKKYFERLDTLFGAGWYS